MEIIIQSLGFKASASLDQYVREKLEKIDHHSNNIVRMNVTLFAGPESEPENNYCEIRPEIRGNDPFVKKNAKTYEEAVANAVDALDMILQKAKDKHISSRHNNVDTMQ